MHNFHHHIISRLPDPAQAEALTARLDELARLTLEANRTMNLTADDDPERFWARHILDALAAAWRLEAAIGPAVAEAALLDVGSGAGMPGLAWALLWPRATVSLLETRSRRVEFLRQTARQLGLERLEVLHGRAEELAREPRLRERFDLVTARALAPLPVLAELTLPFTRVGGRLAAIKSADGLADEIQSARRAFETMGAEPTPPALPYERGDGKPCALVLVRKLRPTPALYPRRAGVPAKKPLA